MHFTLHIEPFCLLCLNLDRIQVYTFLNRLGPIMDLPGEGEVEVLIAGDATIADLNSRFLQCPGPTNVLSFPDGHDGGQLVISSQAVLREVFLYQRGTSEHFLRLLAHGLLHLAGHEHGERMFDLTEEAVFRLMKETVPNDFSTSF
ncbi:MAG: rRNA maturation RNase YbeY [Thermodesulfobacteriota bacterium]